MSTQAQLSHVKLSDIELSITNKIFRSPGELTKESLGELIESIKQKGVISPVLLRRHNNKYELVAGERRYRASQAAGLDTVPAYIRTLSDQEALDMQITENLQRKDVHPMKEARGYKYLIDQDPKKNTIAELALRFGKSESYVMQRLKLIDLIPEAAKDFEGGSMSLSHALLIARLQPADQKETLRRCSSGSGEKKFYDSAAELSDFIEQSVMLNLKKAPFDCNDAKLVPSAGSCASCPKRSGANQLFADVESKDRCFDRACYREKAAAALVISIREAIEKKPDIVFLEERHVRDQDKTHPKVAKVLSELKAHVLKEGSDFAEYNYSNYKPIKGIYINGQSAGHEKVVYDLKKKASPGKASEPGKVPLSDQIAAIRFRDKRAAELDGEKVYSRVLEEMQKHKATKLADTHKVNAQAAERALFCLLVYNYADFQTRHKIERELKLGSHGKARAERFKKFTEKELAYMARQVFVNQWTNPMMYNATEGILLHEVAAGWGIDVKKIQAEQKAIAAKRAKRSAERIAELKREHSKSRQKTGSKVAITKKTVKSK